MRSKGRAIEALLSPFLFSELLYSLPHFMSVFGVVLSSAADALSGQ